MSYDAKPVYFYDPAASTSQLKEAILSFQKTWLIKHSSADDLNLYHYTTLEGLKGILNSRSIWFTHVSALNDPLELKYGETIILKILNDFIKTEKNDTIKHILDDISIYIKSFNSNNYQTYVACFCESENLLSQWRAYGFRGGGFNLGLRFKTDTKFYHSKVDKEESHIILRKIIYDIEEQYKLVSDYLSIIVKSATVALNEFTKNNSIPLAWSSIAAIESVNLLIDLMLTFKNPAFKEEAEWRLIKGRQTNIKPEHLEFRESIDGLIPYINTYIQEEIKGNFIFPLNSIKFGPTLDEVRTQSSIHLFLNKEAASDETIKINANDINITGAGYVLRNN